MPEDADLYNILEVIVANIRERYFGWAAHKKYHFSAAIEHVAFIAIRTTPGITPSPFDGKPMPRIIVGIREGDDSYREVHALLYLLENALAETKCIGVPRYSERYKDSCIFWAYGSADYKDSEEGKKLYKSKNLDIDADMRQKKVYPLRGYKLPNPTWQPALDLKRQTADPKLRFKRNK